jgi:hypothetical protein
MAAAATRPALAALAAAVLAAAGWWPSAGTMAVLASLPRDMFGVPGGLLAGSLPVIAWRLFRSPHFTDANARIATRLFLCMVAASGAAALLGGRPSPMRQDWAGLRGAGGLAGWAVTAPATREDLSPHDRTLWRMLYETAARSAKVLVLDVEDLDLPNRRARVRRKGGAVDLIVWQAGTARLLPRLLKGRK